MKKVLLFAAMLAVAASCTVQEIDSIKGTTAPEITASYENNGTKTTITTDEEGVGTIWWKPADEINVFYGTTSTHYVSKNKENATTVAFGTTDIIGSTESAQENIWGLYPYNEDAVCDGESVITTISAIQKGVAGTFDDDIFTSLAHSTSTVMTFYNVLGGIKFSLSRDDIKKITFKGNNSEDIAGKVKLEMDANGKPAAEVTEGEKTIILTPKEGTTFSKNTNYYLVMLPTVLSKGFTMTFETETAIGTFEYTTKSIEIKRSVFSKKENIDTYATFVANVPYVDLGLSVKWATYNIGASVPEEYGDYYAWGETDTHYNDGDAQKKTGVSWKSGKSGYIWQTYKHCTFINDYSYGFTKYVSEVGAYNKGYNGEYDNKFVLEPEDDVAYIKYGEGWRMPTIEEFKELYDNCNISTTSNYNGTGVKGVIFTSKIEGYTDKSIFLPAAGDRSSKDLNDFNSYCRYWTSSLVSDNGTSTSRAWIFILSSTTKLMDNDRYMGCSVRPVKDDSNSSTVAPTGITLNRTELQIEVGNHSPLSVSSILPLNATNKNVIWNSDSPSIATVNEYGNVEGISLGTATITATTVLGSVVATCTVSVMAEGEVHHKIQLWENGPFWADTNIGADSPEESGYYFSRANVIGYIPSYPYSDSYCKWVVAPGYEGSGTPLLGGFSNGNYEITTGYSKRYSDIPANTDYDAAKAIWGGNWRIPTNQELKDLISNTTQQWMSNYNNSGVSGYKFTGKGSYNSKSIFLPAAGYGNPNGGIDSVGNTGKYWSSSYYMGSARYLNVYNGNLHTNYSATADGLTIRAVSN